MGALHLPSTTAAQREARRALVGLLHGLGHGKAQIARALDVSRPTVYRDLEALEEGTAPAGGREATAQLRAVFNQLWAPVHADLKRQGLDPADRLVLTRALWAAYLEKVRTEQAFGFLPRAPERVEVDVDLGEALAELLDAVAGRLSFDACMEYAEAMRGVGLEAPELLRRLGLHE